MHPPRTACMPHLGAQLWVLGVLQVKCQVAVLGLVLGIHASVLRVHGLLHAHSRRAGVAIHTRGQCKGQRLSYELPDLVPRLISSLWRI
eukprot:scaffold185780_cov15-Tisochrysis_lutea.AAC.2